jgi:hypothetical protein
VPQPCPGCGVPEGMRRTRITLAAVLVLAVAPAARATAWTQPVTIGGLDGTADVAVDADGTATVAAGGTLPRLAQRAPRGLFGEPVGVAPLSPGPPDAADVAAAGHGALAAAWQDGYGRIVAVARDPGGMVSAPQQLSPADGKGVNGPQVAVGADGGTLVAWLGVLEHAGRGLVYAAYRPPGGTFGVARALTRTPATYPPSVAMSAAGRAVITWRRMRRTEAVSVEHGRFGRVSVVGRPLLDGRPVVAVAGDGAAVIAWSEQRPVDPMRRTVATWRTADGRFATPRVLRATPAHWTAGLPVVAAGTGGDTAVAWTEGHGPFGQVVAVRGPSGQRQTVRPLGPHKPRRVAVAIRPGGRTTVAWDQPRGGYATPDILVTSARRGDGFGTPLHVAAPQAQPAPVYGVDIGIASGGPATVVVWTIPYDGTSAPRVLWSAQDGG